MIKKVHHVGIAVNNLNESIALFEKLLGVKAHVEEAPCQRVTEAVFKVGGGIEIDLLEPMGPDSAVAKFLEKRGEGLHHIALEVDNIDADLKEMEAKGVRLIDKEGREGVAGKIGFLHPKSVNGVLVELVQPRGERER
jgi:methylmalonyl-CoA/ethylmalonyl-CoA epimerase